MGEAEATAEFEDMMVLESLLVALPYWNPGIAKELGFGRLRRRYHAIAESGERYRVCRDLGFVADGQSGEEVRILELRRGRGVAFQSSGPTTLRHVIEVSRSARQRVAVATVQNQDHSDCFQCEVILDLCIITGEILVTFCHLSRSLFGIVTVNTVFRFSVQVPYSVCLLFVELQTGFDEQTIPRDLRHAFRGVMVTPCYP